MGLRNVIVAVQAAAAILVLVSSAVAAPVIAPDADKEPANWRMFDDPPDRKDYKWSVAFEEFTTPVGEAPIKREQNGRYVELKGQYGLNVFDQPNSVLRLRFSSRYASIFMLDFKAGDQHYRIQIDSKQSYYTIIYRVVGDQLFRLTDDAGHWYAYKEGLVDVRYEDGHIVVARGSVPLVAAPIPDVPVDMVMTTETKFSLIKKMTLPPLGIQIVDPFGLDAEKLAPANRLAWTIDTAYHHRGHEDPVEIVNGADGSVEFRTNDGERERRLFAPMTSSSPMAITMRIDSVLTGGVTFYELSGRSYSLYGSRRGENTVICGDPFNNDDVKRHMERGFVYNGPFYIRAVYGLDYLTLQLSSGGHLWSTYAHHALATTRSPRVSMVSLVLPGRKAKSKQHIRLSNASVENVKILSDFVDPQMVHARPTTEEGRRQWEMAANWMLINSWAQSDLKRQAAEEFVDRLIDDGVPTARVIQAIRELATFSRPYRISRGRYSVDVEKMMEQLGRRMIIDDEMAAVPGWLDLWYMLNFDVSRHAYAMLPEPIIRAYLYHLRETEQWETLRYRAMQTELLSRTSTQAYLSDWMLDQARSHLDDKLTAEELASAKRWVHPLRITTDRETANLIGEFFSAVQIGEIERACQVLTKGGDVESFAPSPDDDRLFVPTEVMLRNFIDSRPEVQKMLVDKFSRVGAIRLNRSLQQNRMDALLPIAVQFHGTDAARRALALLADRELSSGRFTRAVARYSEAIPKLEGADKRNAIAKRKLALAMLGQTNDDVIDGDVELPSGVYSPSDFQLIIDSVTPPKQVELEKAASVAGLPAVPKSGISVGATVDLDFNARYPVGLAQSGTDLLLQQSGKIKRINTAEMAIVWEQDTAGKLRADSFAFRPLILADRVLSVLWDGKSYKLNALALADGKTQWRRGFEHEIISHPVAIGSSVYLLTVSRRERLYLHRLNLADGSSERSPVMLNHHQNRRQRNIIELAGVGRVILISANGTLVGRDQSGETLWVRRQEYIPEEVDASLSQMSQFPGIFASGDNVVMASHGLLNLSGIRAADGEQLWQRPEIQRRDVLKHTDDVLYVGKAFSVEAVSTADGSSIWQSAAEGETHSLVGADGSFVQVVLDKVESTHRYKMESTLKSVRWINEADGSEISSWELPEDQRKTGSIFRMFGGGGRILMLQSPGKSNRDSMRLGCLMIN
jgi:outer membrane protein assembly factor BamB